MLEIYFENKKQSGGGEIEKIDYHKEEGYAILLFNQKKGILAYHC